MTDRPQLRTGQVYLVTAGEYSDFRVMGVFENRDLAQAAITNGFGEEIRPYKLLNVLPQKRIFLNLKFDPRDKEPQDEWSYLVWDTENYPECEVVDTDRFRAELWVHGWNNEKVRKVFSDERARMMAVVEGVAE